MKTGDLVRFRKGVRNRMIATDEKWKVGLLLEYHTWEKIGTILYEGNIYRVRAENIQKAGKKDANQTRQ